MAVSAKLRYLRMAPRKVRMVADLIRGKKTNDAQNILSFTDKKTAGVLQKLLKQAIANAKNNFKLDDSNLYISKILVDEGPKLKRFMPRARGSAYEIQKKTSHITIVLDEIKGGTESKIKKIKAEEKKSSEEIATEQRAEDMKAEKSQQEVKPSAKHIRFKPEAEISKPKVEKGIKRIFRRKAF